MTLDHLLWLCVAISLIAFLYSSVGHAGASGYIAVMAFFGLSPSVIRPSVLVLNILVACLTSWQFWRAGHFSWPLFWPFALASIPLAFLGGYLNLPTPVFKIVVGLLLLYSAIRFFLHPKPDDDPRPPSRSIAAVVGAGLGLLAGLTGTGGGVFLSQIMHVKHWARTRTASASAALFIFGNSVSALLGNLSSTKQLPLFTLPLVVAAVSGGAVGSYLGSHRFSPAVIKRLLALVLFVAGLKLIFS